MITFYDELIDFLCPNTRDAWRPLILPSAVKIPSGRTWQDMFEYMASYSTPLLPNNQKLTKQKEPMTLNYIFRKEGIIQSLTISDIKFQMCSHYLSPIETVKAYSQTFSDKDACKWAIRHGYQVGVAIDRCSKGNMTDQEIKMMLSGIDFSFIEINEPHTPLLPKEKPWRPTFTKLVEEFYKTLDLLNNPIKQPQMKQTKFNKADMISVITPRGTTVAILAEDFTYEKPCMVAVKAMLTHDGTLVTTTGDSVGQLYIHQDCLEVRLANEQEGLRLFSAIKASGAEYPSVNGKEVKEFVPSDGDFCHNDHGSVFIYKGKNTYTDGDLHHCWYSSKENRLSLDGSCISQTGKATPYERQLLLDALASDGKTWNATEKRVENVLWRAKEGGRYFIPEFDTYLKEFKPKECTENLTAFDNSAYRIGIQFPSTYNCQLLCDQLNAVIKANKESRIKLD